MYHVTTISGKGCFEPRYLNLHQFHFRTSAIHSYVDSTSHYNSDKGADRDSDCKSDNEKDGDGGRNNINNNSGRDSDNNSSSSFLLTTINTNVRNKHTVAPLHAVSNVLDESSVSNTINVYEEVILQQAVKPFWHP